MAGEKLDLGLLAILKGERHHWVALAELAEKVGYARRVLERCLKTIEDAGFVVQEHPHFGLRLLEDPWPLLAAEIQSALPGTVIGREIIVLERASSTMEVAAALARRGRSEGTVVFAEEQTKGRGRLGRTWHGLPGKDLLFSVILRPVGVTSAPAVLALSAAVAVASCLKEHLGLEARIRWPNDVVIAKRKVAGILVERETPNLFILGVGLNVLARSISIPGATTVAIERDGWVDRTELARALLVSLDNWYGKAVSGKIGEIDAELSRLSVLLGKRVTVRLAKEVISGKVGGVSTIDGLRVEVQGGEIFTLKAEQVRKVELEE